ncbi:MAG: hypothetical protein ABII82_20565 [Verrucomicrobiota bacterium]
MKTHTSFTKLASALAVCALLALPAVVRAADYYLQRNQSQGWSWHTVNSGTGWFATPTGGNSISEIDPTGDYQTNGFQLRTREAKGHDTDHFPGSRLILNGANGGKGADVGTLVLKSMGDAVAKVDVLIAEQAAVTTGSGGAPQNLHVGTFSQTGTTTFIANAPGRGFNLAFDKLAGGGAMTFVERDAPAGTTSVNLAVADAAGFTGTIALQGGVLGFDQDLRAPKATLELASGAGINLNGKTVSVAALKVGDETLKAGDHTAADLKSRGLKASGAGKITVGAK